ncbi:unnamed protein product [Prorocentrum cordatum]|uniref:Uncharacterized protein n=1 Tax=Prorocentrum cordatum TaxID=2364126 RepID=A0ABN9VNV5_9DINO|nr:unnamed protein product [Polarella glacialis]
MPFDVFFGIGLPAPPAPPAPLAVDAAGGGAAPAAAPAAAAAGGAGGGAAAAPAAAAAGAGAGGGRGRRRGFAQPVEVKLRIRASRLWLQGAGHRLVCDLRGSHRVTEVRVRLAVSAAGDGDCAVGNLVLADARTCPAAPTASCRCRCSWTGMARRWWGCAWTAWP